MELPDGKDLLALVERQGRKCYLTGRDLTPQTASLEHKIPCCRGGASDIFNLAWCLSDVNKAKGNRTDAEFIALCRDVVRVHGME